MARLQRLLRRQSSASDSILRCLERKWPACSVCCDDDLPRPTPFFVAAKKNSSACRTPLASIAASILDFKAKLGNRCKETLKNSQTAASILDFRARLGNRCKVFLGNSLFRASILDFKAKLANRCMFFPVYAFLCASILDFRARLGNHCRICRRHR